MELRCPHCGFSKDIDPAKLPADAKRATCPKCHQKFDLQANLAPPEAGPDTPVPPPIPDRDDADRQLAEAIPAAADEYEPVASRRETPPPAPEPLFADGPAPPPLGIPWETRPGTLGQDTWATIKMLLFNPAAFFDRMPPHGPTGPALKFALLVGSVGFIFYLLWIFLISMAGAGFSGELKEVPLIFVAGGFLVLAALTPLFMLIGLYIGAFFLHLFLMIARGANNGFSATLRVLAYSTASYMFNIVPFLGAMVCGVWMLVIMIIGLPKAHQTGVGRVVIAIFVIPFLLFFLLGIGLAILGGIVANM